MVTSLIPHCDEALGGRQPADDLPDTAALQLVLDGLTPAARLEFSLK